MEFSDRVYTLGDVIKAVSAAGKFHICIHDLSGILKNPHLCVDYSNEVHSSAFCEGVKSVKAGFELCMRCKGCANFVAIRKKQPFSGLCSFGLFEVAHPVVIDGKTVCIVYLGNIVTNRASSLSRLRKACEKTGAPFKKLSELLDTADTDISPESAMLIAGAVDSYIRLLYEKYKHETPAAGQYHWAVQNIKKYADENYTRTFTLDEVCRLYFVNEKYAGKLFCEQVGMSFHEYLNKLRLSRAEKELIACGERIIDIAMRCGFENVSYFNRKFKERFGVSPSEYRKKKSGK